MRRNWAILRPGETFPGTLLLICEPRTPLRELIPLLQATRDSEYRRLLLAFGGWRSTRRPVLGELQRPEFSAAAARLAAAGEAAAPGHHEEVMLALDPERDCDAFVRELAALRNAGRRVRVQLPHREGT